MSHDSESNYGYVYVRVCFNSEFECVSHSIGGSDYNGHTRTHTHTHTHRQTCTDTYTASFSPFLILRLAPFPPPPFFPPTSILNCDFVFHFPSAMGRGPKKHLKRLNAPKHWMLDKLAGSYV